MDTDALIRALARDTTPVSPFAVQRGLGVGIFFGAAMTLLLLIGWLGVRPDLKEAIGQSIFWGKAGYTFSLGLAGMVFAGQLARPDSEWIRWIWLPAIPLGALLIFATGEMLAASPPERVDLVLAPRWICLPLILVLSAPIFAGVAWAFHTMAPTRLSAAGAAAGLAAGGVAATLYGLYCQQVSPTYILTRYTVAVALASAVGALVGPRLSRW